MADPDLRVRLCRLLSVKSLVTLVLTVVFAALTLTGRVSADQYMTVFSVVVAFYFGTQTEKKSQGNAQTA
ncbi:MAG: hypothetical protein IJP02_02070 [Oscillospiraceae bacterium]|nr:hypothetical protein [Oscillospiraceae bacterium]